MAVAGDSEAPPSNTESTARRLGRLDTGAALASKEHHTDRQADGRLPHQGMDGVTRLPRLQLLEERARKLAERYGLELKASEWQTTAPDDTVLRVDKPIRIRIRRTCHSCSATFAAANECPDCEHVYCSQCRRYPPRRAEADRLSGRERRDSLIRSNRENPPLIADFFHHDSRVVLRRPSKTGGPDLIRRKPRQRVRRTCHECRALFMTGDNKCAACGHMRCTDCPRDPPKKDKYPFGYPGDAFGPYSIPRYECERCETLFPEGVADGSACFKCGVEKSGSSPRALPRKIEPEPDPDVLRAIRAKLDILRVVV